MGGIISSLEELDVSSPIITRLLVVLVVFLGAVAIERIAIRGLRRAYWRRVERMQPAVHIAELRRTKRQQTIVTLLESVVRYGIFGCVVAVGVTLLAPGVAGALFGASLLVILVGFGLQRLIGDVVAGGLLLFEGHFAVGDVITVHQQEVTGVVEDFSLRTTSLRTLGGDRVTILNSAMLSFTRWSFGQREFHLDIIVSCADADRSEVLERVEQICESQRTSTALRYVEGPVVISHESIEGSELTRIEVRIVTPPTFEHLAQHCAGLFEAYLAEQIVGSVAITNVHEASFEQYRSALLVRPTDAS